MFSIDLTWLRAASAPERLPSGSAFLLGTIYKATSGAPKDGISFVDLTACTSQRLETLAVSLNDLAIGGFIRQAGFSAFTVRHFSMAATEFAQRHAGLQDDAAVKTAFVEDLQSANRFKRKLGQTRIRLTYAGAREHNPRSTLVPKPIFSF